MVEKSTQNEQFNWIYTGGNMRAVITVIGKDTVGILSMVSGICAEANAKRQKHCNR